MNIASNHVDEETKSMELSFYGTDGRVRVWSRPYEFINKKKLVVTL